MLPFFCAILLSNAIFVILLIPVEVFPWYTNIFSWQQGLGLHWSTELKSK